MDIVFCHRPDPRTPMVEVVRGMNFLIDQGLAFYWGTSEWTAQMIEVRRAFVAPAWRSSHAPSTAFCRRTACPHTISIMSSEHRRSLPSL